MDSNIAWGVPNMSRTFFVRGILGGNASFVKTYSEFCEKWKPGECRTVKACDIEHLNNAYTADLKRLKVALAPVKIENDIIVKCS